MENKTAVTDLIPKGLGFYWFVFFSVSALIALLEFAWLNEALLCEKLWLVSIPALDVTSRSGFLAWLVSLLFLLNAAVALANFRLGRKYDDPNSRVAAWFWMAAAMLFLSLDSQVSVRPTLCELFVIAGSTALNGHLYVTVSYVFFLGLIGTRILPDLARDFPALSLFLLATVCSASGTVIELFPATGKLVASISLDYAIVLYTGLKSWAVLLCLLACTLFARRQVFRDPEVVQQWFAKIWKQTPVVIVPAANIATESQSDKKTSVEKPAAHPDPMTDGGEQKVKARSTADGGRPLVTKPDENDDSENKDEDFDLSALL